MAHLVLCICTDNTLKIIKNKLEFKNSKNGSDREKLHYKEIKVK